MTEIPLARYLEEATRLGGVDFHLHSRYSDGAQSPRELVDEVLAKRLRAFSLTDHDSMAGVLPVRAALRDLDAQVRFIPGVECSCRFEGQEVHVLGYFTEDQPQAMLDYLEEVVLERQERNRRMIARLNQLGYAISEADLAGTGEDDEIRGRVHMALWLVEHAGFPSIASAFQKLLNEGRPAYVARKKRELGQVAEVIRKGGGVAVLAHPQQYGWCDRPLPGSRTLDCRFSLIRDQGILGVECFHGKAGPEESAMIQAAASRLGLFCIAGSDSHGREDQHAAMYRLESSFFPRDSS